VVVGQTGEYVDVLVLGGGPAGYSSAIRAAQLGRSVVLVERQHIGGICLNDGCIPSKALLSASRLLRQCQDAAAMGINVNASLDFARLQDWKDSAVRRLSEGVSQLLSRYNVRVKSATGHFASPHRVAVESGAEFEFFDFGSAIVASGSSPCAPSGLTIDGQFVVSPEQALALNHLPERIALLGGGYIALELATAFSRLGSSVVVITADDRVLPELEPAISQAVARGLHDLGVEIVSGARVRTADGGMLALESEAGVAPAVKAEMVVAASERKPNTEGLGLDRAGVAVDGQGWISADTRGRTSVPTIYGAGDVVAGPLVAARAIAQGRAAAEVVAGLPSAYEPAAVPLAYFTEPEVMSAGLSESAALELGLAVRAARFPFAASGRAVTLAERQGFLQIVAEEGSGRVVGIHAAGAGVTELAGEAALAIEMGATLDDLALTMHPHPTLSEAIPEAAWLALGEPLHVFRGR